MVEHVFYGATINVVLAFMLVMPTEGQVGSYEPGIAGFPAFTSPKGVEDTLRPPSQVVHPNPELSTGELEGQSPQSPDAQPRTSPDAENDMGKRMSPSDSAPVEGASSQGQTSTEGPNENMGMGANDISGSPPAPVDPSAVASGGTQLAGGTAAAARESGSQAGPALQKLTEFRSRHRKTIDGRLCAAAFVHEGQTYTDCTDARSPDGTTGTFSNSSQLPLSCDSQKQVESGVTWKFSC